MARTELTVQQIVATGLNPTYSAANADGHSVQNNGLMFLHVKNGSGSAITVTIDATQTVAGLAVTDLQVSVPASGERMIGPLEKDVFKQAGQSGCVVYVDFSDVTSVTIAACRL